MKLNRAKDYYKNDKKDYEREQEINIEIYLKNKKIKREYRYHNIPKEKPNKQALKIYEKHYCEAKKIK